MKRNEKIRSTKFAFIFRKEEAETKDQQTEIKSGPSFPSSPSESNTSMDIRGISNKSPKLYTVYCSNG
jgi:hypothetical protein